MRIASSLAAIAFAAGLGCAPAPPPAPAAPAPPPPKAVKREGLFIEDDYDAAVTEAKAHKALVVVDVWAAWCGPCLHFRGYVLSDPRVERLSTSFVFSALDVDNPANYKFTSEYHSPALPTIWVIDPVGGHVVRRHSGGLRFDELEKFLLRAFAASKRDAPASALERAADASDNEDYESALDRYKHAQEVPETHDEATVGILETLARARRYADCAEIGDHEVSRIGDELLRPEAVEQTLECGLKVSKSDPRLAKLAEQLARAARNKDLKLEDATRSSFYSEAIDFLFSKGDDVNRLASDWGQFLDGAAARAPSPKAARAWLFERVVARVRGHKMEEALEMALRAEAGNPQDFEAASSR